MLPTELLGLDLPDPYCKEKSMHCLIVKSSRISLPSTLQHRGLITS